MKCLACFLVAAATIVVSVSFADRAEAVTIDLVPVGNPGNANHVFGFGAVSYAYNIGKYEVTVGQYTEFLNAVADTDTYELYNIHMGASTAVWFTGIARTGASGSFSYAVIGSANHPVGWVSWGDAARFANWLHNGQPTGLQNSNTTEDGSYLLNGATTGGSLNAVVRKPSATWGIPSENEWYKAAYHQPAAQGGNSNNYWLFPTGTNNWPNSDQPPGHPSIQNNAVNYYRNDGLANGYNDGFAVNGSTICCNNEDPLTDVGAYTSSPSFYGTFDQGGNLWEWNEAVISGSYRGYRGGAWYNEYFDLATGNQNNFASPAFEGGEVGFRVASIIPEPSTLLLLCFGSLAMHSRRRGLVCVSIRIVLLTSPAPTVHAAEIRTVALSGQQVPGAPDGTVFTSFQLNTGSFGLLTPLVLNDAGQTAFLGRYSNGSSLGSGILSEGSGSLNLVAATGQQAPGMPDGVTYTSFNRILINDAGATAFSAYMTIYDGYQDWGFWSSESGTSTLIARAGEQAAGTPAGVVYNLQESANSLVFNDAGQSAFGAFIGGSTGDSGIWAQRHGNVELVARKGSHAPGTPDGVNFSDVPYQRAPALNNSGRIAFYGWLTGSGVDAANSRGLWSGAPGSLALVARTGDHAPGTEDGVVFSGFGSSREIAFGGRTLILNAAGQTAIYAGLTGSGVDATNNLGIFATDRSGALQLIARKGDPLEVTAGDLRTISGLGFLGDYHNAPTGNSDSRPSLFNNRGQLAFLAQFTDGTSGIFVSNRVAVPEPSTLLLGALAGMGLLWRRLAEVPQQRG